MNDVPADVGRDGQDTRPSSRTAEEAKSFQLSQHHATVIAALIALVGGLVGHFVTSWTALGQNDRNATAQTQQANDRLKHEMALQSTKQEHEIKLERQKFIQQTIGNVVGKGTVEQQQTSLRFYAEVGIIEEPYASKILKLRPDQLPVATPGKGAVAPVSGKFVDGVDLTRLALPGFGIVAHRINSLASEVGSRWIPSDFFGGPFAAPGPRFIVVDFAAADRLDQLLTGMKAARASVHVVIDRDGAVAQLVPFDVVAYHAGASSYSGITGLNQHSIGIELVNNGRLNRSDDGSWVTWSGHVVPPERVFIESGDEKQAWERYTEAQLASLAGVIRSLKTAYPSLQEVVGQSDISPGRKLGPGPALNLSALKPL
ncbi:N-acetylmuramoyl-L-alanine amidase [Bosea sp. (in: a-proteobacteria)]|uniref:N-acetylmuramoyl-L-alanine amidase n=1 Tax=Bosea sp. (in: a-proteobacteria) TaxID=1871050 RepID=UPI001AC6F72B|nr:N-acetylmuramoyl-L-alanine amidase [Bosea sp. (in: a-proteobacteria)]MBN9437076.1 N-acetylmuramoyl-L-alanine amidase [Bosea sp. (in: a-proteobacteria)]